MDVMLGDNKSQETAETFFYQCHDTAGFEPDMITTDKKPALESWIKAVFEDRVEHQNRNTWITDWNKIIVHQSLGIDQLRF